MAEVEQRSPHRQRRSSYGLIPPHMSELNVVLLGNSWSLKSSVVNLLLKQTKLKAMRETPNCKTYKGEMNGQLLTVVNTADLQHTNRAEFIDDIKTLNGPLVFLLVLQPEDFTEEHKYKLYSLLLSFSEKAFERSLVLISTAQAETSWFLRKIVPRSRYKWDQNPHIRDTIIKCHYRYLCIKNTEDDLKLGEFKRKELFTRIRQMLEKTEENLSCGPSQEEHPEKKPPLNLVLCGRAGAEKTSVIKAMLEEDSAAVSSGQRVKYQGEVCGRWLSLVELPPLYDKSEEEVMEQCLSCLSLCAPQGVQAFILVLPLGPVTDKDKEEMKIIQDTFSSAVKPFTKILFTVDSHPEGPEAVTKQLQGLSQSCAEGYLTFNTRGQQQVKKMLDSVEKLIEKNRPHSFTMRRMMTAQLRDIQRLKNRGTVRGPEASADCLRIALIGKTGCGKSSSGNTILGRAEFEALMSPASVTQSCAKAEAEVDGRHVVVVDTPGLFDSSLTNDEVIEETSKCVGLLAPGPHVFLLVIQIGRFTKEEKEAVDLIKKGFGKESQKYTMILFTRGDDLQSESCTIKQYIERNSSLKKLVSDCGNRYHVFNNKNKSNRSQVTELIRQIDAMVQENGGDCYTNDMFQNAEATIKREMERIMKEKEEETRREREEMERKHQQEMEGVKQEMEKQKEQTEKERERREQELREKEEEIKKEQEKREKEVRRRREEEERQRQDWEQKQRDLEEKIKSESQSKEAINQKLQESRDKMEEEKTKWENERKEWWKKREEGEQEERKRREEEERHRQEWDQKQKDLEEKIKSESETKEAINQKLQESRERMEEEKKKWENERKEWWKKREEGEQEVRKRREEEERQRQDWDQKRRDLEEKIKSESETKEALDKQLQESRDTMEKERQKWENERKEWKDKQEKEDKEKLEELQKEKDKIIKEHQEQREKEVEDGKKKIKDLEEKHEKEMEESINRSKQEARAEAEKEFQKKEKEKMKENRTKINDIVKCIVKKSSNVTEINKKLQEHERELNKQTDESQKDQLLEKLDKEVSELIQKMLKEENTSWCTIL